LFARRDYLVGIPRMVGRRSSRTDVGDFVVVLRGFEKYAILNFVHFNLSNDRKSGYSSYPNKLMEGRVRGTIYSDWEKKQSSNIYSVAILPNKKSCCNKCCQSLYFIVDIITDLWLPNVRVYVYAGYIILTTTLLIYIIYYIYLWLIKKMEKKVFPPWLPLYVIFSLRSFFFFSLIWFPGINYKVDWSALRCPLVYRSMTLTLT